MLGPGVTVRAASPEDGPAIGRVWHAAWHDGHDGHVPDSLQAVRTEESFHVRAAQRVPSSLVAVLDGPDGSEGRDGTVVGFVTVEDDELEQVFVDRAHRGTGVADALVAAGLARVRVAGHRSAWLAVVAGNARARRFYERQGFVDHGPFEYLAEGPDGPIPLPNHRYVRRLDRPALAEALDLEPHPEGGWYRQTWASPVTVDLPDLRVRPTATLILFLLPAGESSAWHRVASDEVWIAQEGRVDVELGGSGDGPVAGGETLVVGHDHPHAVVPAGVWQRTVPSEADALVSCLVSPGFHFADFELEA